MSTSKFFKDKNIARACRASAICSTYYSGKGGKFLRNCGDASVGEYKRVI